METCGWNAGILYELDKNNRYALTYRSEVKIDFKGSYSNDLPIAINRFNLPIPTATGGATQSSCLTLNLPGNVGKVSVAVLAPQWAHPHSGLYQLEPVRGIDKIDRRRYALYEA